MKTIRITKESLPWMVGNQLEARPAYLGWYVSLPSSASTGSRGTTFYIPSDHAEEIPVMPPEGFDLFGYGPIKGSGENSGNVMAQLGDGSWSNPHYEGTESHILYAIRRGTELHRLNFPQPSLLADLPAPPELEGHRWEYRGMGWKSGKKCRYATYSKHSGMPWGKGGLSHTFASPDLHYIEYLALTPPAPIKAEAGKRYHTREGGISGYISIREGYTGRYPMADETAGFTYAQDGRRFYEEDHGSDLISEHIEAPEAREPREFWIVFAENQSFAAGTAFSHKQLAPEGNAPYPQALFREVMEATGPLVSSTVKMLESSLEHMVKSHNDMDARLGKALERAESAERELAEANQHAEAEAHAHDECRRELAGLREGIRESIMGHIQVAGPNPIAGTIRGKIATFAHELESLLTAGEGQDEIPDECVASGQGCSYAETGPNGERQCRYCGQAPEQPEPRWRMLEAFEVIKDGDEFKLDGMAEWKPAAQGAIGSELWAENVGVFRRPLSGPEQESVLTPSGKPPYLDLRLEWSNKQKAYLLTAVDDSTQMIEKRLNLVDLIRDCNQRIYRDPKYAQLTERTGA